MHNCHMLLFFSLDEYINVHSLCKQIEIDEKKKEKKRKKNAIKKI